MANVGAATTHSQKVIRRGTHDTTDEEMQPDAEYHMCGNRIGVRTRDLNQPFEDIRKRLDEIVESHFARETTCV